MHSGWPPKRFSDSIKERPSVTCRRLSGNYFFITFLLKLMPEAVLTAVVLTAIVLTVTVLTKGTLCIKKAISRVNKPEGTLS